MSATTSVNNTKVAFIGLGVMGYPMAGHLSRAGYEVVVYNRTASRMKQWVADYDGQMAATPAAAAKGAQLVFVCVGNDNDVREVVLGEYGVASTMASGSILIDHTTASAELAEELALELGKNAIGFIDAPVSGGQAGAENGQLTVMCGGSESHFQQAYNAMAVYGKAVTLLGNVGSGQRCKMVNQICIAGLVQGLAEGLLFAEKAGLDAKQVVDVISKGAAQSWQMENRAHTMIDGRYNFGFAVDWMRKDLAIVAKEAEKMSLTLPVTSLVDQYYAEVQSLGGGRWDTSSLLVRMQQLAKQSSHNEG